MDLGITIKVKLKLQNNDTSSLFTTMMEQYHKACNYVSEYVFTHNFCLKQSSLNKALYHEIRAKFDLKAQLTQSVIKTVIARYKTVQKQLVQHPYKYKDINTNEWHSEKRDLNWLQKPIQFKRLQADLVRNRDYSYQTDSKMLSINTLQNRVLVTPICHGFDQYLDGSYKLGTAKLLKTGNKWYLHISATKHIDELDTNDAKHVVGIDRGLRFLATSYDKQGKTTFYNGQKIMRKRAKYQRLRAQLQSKGTKSAKRRLKKLSGRENRWMTDVNHQLSKTLVQKYGSNTLFVIEDLTGVNFNRDDLPKTLRYQNSSWSFYQLEHFLTYKALQNHSKVLKVPAAYTSQRCPKCGVIKKSNRNHDTHLYHCTNCNYSSNDDRIGAMNIQLLGTLYTTGTKHPKFVKDEE